MYLPRPRVAALVPAEGTTQSRPPLPGHQCARCVWAQVSGILVGNHDDHLYHRLPNMPSESYEQDAVDYLVKPIHYRAFPPGEFSRCRNVNCGAAPATGPSCRGKRRRYHVQFPLRQKRQAFPVAHRRNLYLEKDGSFFGFVTPEAPAAPASTQALEMLPGEHFYAGAPVLHHRPTTY